MSAVICISAAVGGAFVTEAVMATARETARATAAEPGPVYWLDPGNAGEFPITTQHGADRTIAAVREALAGLPVDANTVDANNRRKKLLVADMDSTIVTGETLDELADFAGIKGEIAAITARAMNGELDFAQALRARVRMLEGLSVDAIDGALARLELTPGAKTLVSVMRAAGAYTALVSGGFEPFTAKVQSFVGFHYNQANRLEIADGKLTGAVGEPILGREAKLETLHRLAATQGITVGDAITVGDGANDLAMLQAAGMGVAFHAKPSVASETRLRIDHGDLTSLLYLQGYTRADIDAAT